MSGRQKGEFSGAAARKTAEKRSMSHKGRSDKANDLGRALRTVYDDTLREPVPDDLRDLLGKLS